MPAPWEKGFRVVTHGRIHGQATVNVTHFATNQVIVDEPALLGVLEALLAAWIACIIDTLLPAVTQDWTLEFVEAIPIAPTPGDPVTKVPENPAVGALSASSTSFESQLVFIRTGTGGRSGRGKMFLPPAGENQTANSVYTGMHPVTMNQFLQCVIGKFIGAAATTPFRIGVLSRKEFANTPANFNDAFKEATTLQFSPLVAIMSSRKVGRGS